MTAKVTSKGQVTLPKAVRDLLEIGPGSVIDFQRAPDGRIVVVKVDGTAPRNRFEKLIGSAGIVFSRIVNNLNLVIRSKVYVFIIGRDIEKNHSVLSQFLRDTSDKKE